MKRLLFVSILFLAGLLFTQCNDDCGGSNFTSSSSPKGISEIHTTTQPLWSIEPTANIDSFGIRVVVDFLFTKQEPTWHLINTAYACSPPPVPTFDATEYIDSILVLSEPAYSGSSDITSLLTFERTTDLADFNHFTDRRILNSGGSGYFFLKERPSMSDNYTFSFYYYKDGQVTDSSITLPYFIHNE